MSHSNGNSILKLLGTLLVGIFGLWLIFTLIFRSGLGMGRGYGGSHMVMGTEAGFGAAGTVSLLLLLAIKVLFLLFLVGLVVGIAVAVKKYVFTDEDIQKIKGTLTGKKMVDIKETCTRCGKELNDAWKVCPFCGSEKETVNT
ncbi:MAG: hypothetical protein N2645_06635 [Clostridia bacterium]|nr:hypothetical protein [Clostridia bacterium]